jgi:hypothetical protein
MRDFTGLLKLAEPLSQDSSSAKPSFLDTYYGRALLHAGVMGTLYPLLELRKKKEDRKYLSKALLGIGAGALSGAAIIGFNRNVFNPLDVYMAARDGKDGNVSEADK